jgi:hypothetical protein
MGVEAFDDATILVPSHANFQVTNYHYAIGLIAADRSTVDFQGDATIRGRSWGDAVFAKLGGDAELLLAGSVVLSQDGMPRRSAWSSRIARIFRRQGPLT